jgi:hypothetical protein
MNWHRKAVCCAVLFFIALPLRAEEWQPAETHAVIVGVLEWNAGLTPYPKANRKDQELRDLLVRRGTRPENIAMLLDKAATLSAIKDAVVRTAKAAGPNSTLIIYYAGHGMPGPGDDYFFANYDLAPGKLTDTGWSLKGLGETLAKEFKGKRVILWADCCFSGGLEVVVERLSKSGIAAAALTSAGPANCSTNNWTFTQSIIDGLNGEPIIDANGDGKITLGELNVEVREAMKHREGQQHGFTAKGIGEDFVLAKARGPKPKAGNGKFPIGGYVVPTGRQRAGRLVAVDGDRYVVQFYDYTEKNKETFASKDLTASTGDQVRPNAVVLDVGMKPDCEVEWQKSWWPAKVMKTEKERYYIHYVGFEASWDEWVGKDRIRWPEKK